MKSHFSRFSMIFKCLTLTYLFSRSKVIFQLGTTSRIKEYGLMYNSAKFHVFLIILHNLIAYAPYYTVFAVCYKSTAIIL